MNRRIGGRGRTARAVSAGGVAFRQAERGFEVALVGRLDPERWSLPKGTPDRHESLEQAAIREVAEETGLQVRIVRPLRSIDYWFVHQGIRHFKTVHFYLMEAIGGDPSLHDHEYDVVRWFPIGHAERLVAYQNERDVIACAAAELSALPR